tara:strand:+ start:225 stop:581 length:357 start_codon:yes stop_codon:yes gene_type:complete
MSDESKVLFTFETSVMEDLYVDCDDQLSISQELLNDFFEKGSSNKIFLSLLCESYSLNFKLKEQIENWFENMPITKKDAKELITVPQQEAMLIEASIFAREQIKSDLRKHFHISNHYN